MRSLSWFILIYQSLVVEGNLTNYDCDEPISPNFCITKGQIFKDFPPGPSPLLVSMDLGVTEVSSVDDIKLTITTRMFVTMTWNDERILYTYDKKEKPDIYMDIGIKDQIFIPEVYFYELLKFEAPEVLKKSESLTMSANSNISFYFEGQFTVVCNMDFSNYPLDSQNCIMLIGSISQTSDIIIFDGRLTFNPKFQRTLQYNVDVKMIEDKDKIYIDNWGWKYSVTGISILLKRYTMPFILQFYLPSGMFVLISWIGFVIPYDSGERTGLIVTLLLVVVSMYLAVVAGSPKALTLTAIELWFVTCIAFLFFSLVELGLVMQTIAHLDRYDKKNKAATTIFTPASIFLVNKKELHQSPNNTPTEHVAQLSVEEESTNQTEESKFTRGEKVSHKIDQISMVIFPLSFAIFLIVYSITYSV